MALKIGSLVLYEARVAPRCPSIRLQCSYAKQVASSRNRVQLQQSFHRRRDAIRVKASSISHASSQTRTWGFISRSRQINVAGKSQLVTVDLFQAAQASLQIRFVEFSDQRDCYPCLERSIEASRHCSNPLNVPTHFNLRAELAACPHSFFSVDGKE